MTNLTGLPLNKKIENKLAYFMAVAEAVSRQSKDPNTRVGSTLVNKDTRAIMSTGYNNPVRGAPDSNLDLTRPKKYEYMIHAEANLIYNCAKHGISMANSVVVQTLSPCDKCLRAMWQCGIDTIYFLKPYRGYESVLMLDDVKVVERSLGPYTRLQIKVHD